MAKTRPAKTQKQRNKRQAGRCWAGYEPTPGKKPGTKGSCKPKSRSSRTKAKAKSSTSRTKRTGRTSRSRASR